MVGIDGTTGSTPANRSEINSQIEIVGMRQEENGTESGGEQFDLFLLIIFKARPKTSKCMLRLLFYYLNFSWSVS